MDMASRRCPEKQRATPKMEKNLVRDCKAAYMCVKSSVADDLTSRDELTAALRCAGCNPTAASLLRHWPNGRESLPFSRFCDIVHSEPHLSKRNMEELFEALKICENGSVDLETLALHLTTKGDKLTPDELKSAFDDAPVTPNGKLDYKEFCRRITQTVNEVKTMCERNMESWEDRMKINTKTFVVRKRDRGKLLDGKSPPESPLKCIDHATLENWPLVSSRGCFYFEGSMIISHQYTLDVAVPTRVHLSIYPSNSTRNVDTRMCIYQEEGGRHLVGVSSGLDPHKKWRYWGGNLEPGRYHILPFTSGCFLKRRKTQGKTDEVTLVVKDEAGRISLTNEFKEVLKSVFEQVDLDNNNLLNRQEFNLFNWKTSGEEVRDEEWAVLEENFQLIDGQLTLAGFIDLHQMEAEDNVGDPRELWVTLGSLGYNASLSQDEACPFSLDVRAEQKDSVRLQVSALKAAGLQMALVGLMMEQAESRTLTVGENKVALYSYRDDDLAAIMVENKATSPVKVNIDCSGSANCMTNQESLVWCEEVPGKSVMVAHYLMPETDLVDWTVDCKATLMK